MSAGGEPDARPEIVCICGSARFAEMMRTVNRQLTFAGIIVLAPAEADGPVADEQKAVLDALHLRKIDLSDRVVVVCPNGYIGAAVQREIDHANAAGKPISYVGVARGGESAHLRRPGTPHTAM